MKEGSSQGFEPGNEETRGFFKAVTKPMRSSLGGNLLAAKVSQGSPLFADLFNIYIDPLTFRLCEVTRRLTKRFPDRLFTDDCLLHIIARESILLDLKISE